MPECSSDNTASVDQSSFWSSSGVNWDAHRIGWAISGGCTVVTVILSIISVLLHCRHYIVPAEQRQIIRILYMPPVYAIISFFSYRYFRSYTYYELIEVIYEAITISAFMLLLIEYVASTASGHSAVKALERKDKKSLPIPFCCWRYRPTKAYFMYTIKWSVMQYVIVRPLVSIVAIICQKYNVLCESEGFNFHYANAYLEIVDFVSITVALYGLFIFYGLTREELQGRRPLAKFLCIKLIVMFTYYQSFVFTWLEGRVIKATQYWTETNIADGLTALTICIEMVFFALAMMWAYPYSEYKRIEPDRRTGIWKPLWDSINYSDFAYEIWTSSRFLVDFIRRKPGTHVSTISPSIPTREGGKTSFGDAFMLEGSHTNPLPTSGVGLRTRTNYSRNISQPQLQPPPPYYNSYPEETADQSPFSGSGGERRYASAVDDETVRLTNARDAASYNRPSDDGASSESAGMGARPVEVRPQQQQGYGRAY